MEQGISSGSSGSTAIQEILSHFAEPEGSLSHVYNLLQVYPEPDQFNPHPPNQFV
jgi:hypothetical protein